MDLAELQNRIHNIYCNIERLSNSQTPVQLIAVTKGHPISAIHDLYSLGVRDFGESYLQELKRKKQAITAPDINWHFIGNIQKNKLSEIMSTHLIHSIGTNSVLEKYLDLYNQKKSNNNFKNRFLLQFKLFAEDGRPTGFSLSQAETLIQQYQLNSHQGWAGFSGIGLREKNDEQTLYVFNKAIEHFKSLWTEFKPEKDSTFPTISIGMSEDYHLALQAGTNVIRIGTALVGQRK